LNATGQVNLFKPVAENKQDNIVFEFSGGQGIENYINDTSGLGLDGFVNTNGQISNLGVWGGFLAYQHLWCAKWGSSVGYSYINVDNSSGQLGATYHDGQYVVVNLVYYPISKVTLGLEGLYGVVQDKDGATGNDVRVSFSAQYRF